MYRPFAFRDTRKQLIATFIFTCFLMVIAVWNSGCGGEKKPAVAAKVADPPIVVARHLSDAIANGPFVVEPGQVKTFKFAVNQKMTKPQVEGMFSATGGKNDIEVLLLEETQYLNWQNSHKTDSLYSSGRTTAGRIKVTIPEDTANYYLVFSNKFSYFSNKAVTADVKLSYDSVSGGQ